VISHFELPHFERNHISGIRVRWSSRGNQLEVPDGLRELSGVLGVGPTDIVDDFLGRLDVLVGPSLSGRVVDKTFE
jgi:hypothetical protein